MVWLTLRMMGIGCTLFDNRDAMVGAHITNLNPNTPGNFFCSISMSVPFPTPEGPHMTKTGKSVDGKIVVLVPAGRGGGFIEEAAISPFTHHSNTPTQLTHHSTNPHPLTSLNQPSPTPNQPLPTRTALNQPSPVDVLDTEFALRASCSVTQTNVVKMRKTLVQVTIPLFQGLPATNTFCSAY